MLSIFSRIGTRTSLLKCPSITCSKKQQLFPSININSMQIREMANHRHKKMIKMAKGYRGRANRCFTVAKQRVEKALQYAYRDRRTKKRNYRTLWIQKINAAARIYGYTYASFICHLTRSNVHLNRKMLAELAVNEPLSFKSLIEVARIKGGLWPFRKAKVKVIEKTEEQKEEELFM